MDTGQFVTGKLRVKMTPDMKVKYKDRLESSVVGDMVMVDSFHGRRRVTEKMKQTISSKLEMLKRSSILTNVNASHTEEKGVTENDEKITSSNNTVPNPLSAQARILDKLRLSKQQTQGGGEGVADTDTARSVREKLEDARKQFEGINGQGDKVIDGEGGENTAVSELEVNTCMAADEIFKDANNANHEEMCI